MSAYSLVDRDKLISDGIKIVEDLKRETSEETGQGEPKSTGQSGAKRKSRTKQLNREAKNKSRSDISTTRRNRDRETSESDNGEKIMYNFRHDVNSSESDQQRGGRGGDNIWNDEDDDGTDSRDGRHGGNTDRQASSSGGSLSGGTGKYDSSSPFADLSASDIEKILQLETEPVRIEDDIVAENAFLVGTHDPDGISELLSAPPTSTHRRLQGIKELSTMGEVFDEDETVRKKTPEENIMYGQSRTNGELSPLMSRIMRTHNSDKVLRSMSVDSMLSDTESATSHNALEIAKRFEEDDLNVNDMLRLILANQEITFKKLKKLEKLEAEIKDLKKVVTNQGVVISTIEGYISSMMVAIPGSGVNQENSTKELNPDLRPILGRDKSRGLAELTTGYHTMMDLDVIGSTGYTATIDHNYVQKDLDFSKNNAANFVPTDDSDTIRIILSMIDSHVEDQVQAKILKDWVLDKSEEIPIDDLYNMVVNATDNDILASME